MLAAGSFSQPISPVVDIPPTRDLSEIQDLSVIVTPASRTMAAVTRSASFHDIVVHIAIRKGVGAQSLQEVEDLLGLTEEILRFLDRKNLDSPAAQFMGAENDPIYAADVLRESNLFFSLIKVTYRLMVGV